MTWQDYESTVKYIYETLGEKAGVSIEGYGSRCRILGKSGAHHQIDVLTSHSDGVHKYYTGIECKYWDDKVDKDVVFKTVGISKDCGFDMSIIVSRKGFTNDAILIAKENNIRLVQLSEHNLSISDDVITKYYANMELTIPEHSSTCIIIPEKYKGKYDNHPLLKENLYKSYFEKKNKERIELKDLINQFLREDVFKNDGFEPSSKKITFNENAKFKSKTLTGFIPASGIKITGFKRSYTRLDSDYFENCVWLIMKLIFENKDMVVTLDGKIEERKKGESLQLHVGQQIHIALKFRQKQFLLTTNE